MPLFFHDLKRGKLSLIIWTSVLAFMILICVVIYPEMKAQMENMSEMFSDMGAFSDAFSLDQLGLNDYLGYISIECGEVLGIGGACFAAIVGISALSKEERDKTAELLLTHPISRKKVFFTKLLCVFCQIFILNAAVLAVLVLSTLAIGEDVDMKKLLLVFLSYFILHAEIAFVTFGISAFMRKRGIGIGLGISMFFYFLNIIANISEDVEFIKYITPFAYTNGNYILENSSLEWKYVAIGTIVAVVALTAGLLKYNKKDIL